jgi:hypothetical protein
VTHFPHAAVTIVASMVQKKLLPVHREKKDIEAHLELRERF